MKNNFFDLQEQDQNALIEKAAIQFGMPSSIIEKDIWICWILEKIFSLPIKMAFKGGTSLSKVFNLIHRFSEDCDITIDYRHFNKDIDLKNTSRSQLKKISNQLKEKLQHYIAETIYPFLSNEIKKLPLNGFYKVELDDNGEQIRFYYPSQNTAYLITENGDNLITEDGHSLIAEKNNYLRDHVLIEFGIRNSIEPCENHPIKTYVSAIMPTDIYLPTPTISTLSPIRTFFEKATLIHVECHKDDTKPTPDRFSRHWYDLYMLNNSWVGKEALFRHDILKSVIAYKNAFFHYSFANYEDCISGKFRLVPSEKYLLSLHEDYKDMIKSGMFNEEPPIFEEILDNLSKLENVLNKLRMINTHSTPA